MAAVLTFQQLVTLACQMANTQGFTTQAGQIFNAILEELSQTYDFDATEGFTSFDFNPGLQAVSGPLRAQLQPGCGPYPLPSTFLRADPGDVFWTLLGVPYPMIALDLAEFDMAVQQAGTQSYPYWYTVDMAPLGTGGVPNLFVYPPPSGTYTVYVRYKSTPAAVNSPQTSGAYPWFPSSTYLYTRLAGELMKIANDPRAAAFLGNSPEGAQGILKRILPMIDNPETRSKRVSLDRRRFGRSYATLPNTKTVGW